jgi:ankyrin repeat protein
MLLQMLLDAGLPLTTGSYHTKPSILLQAVFNSNRAMVELLLQHGAELDGDSDYGRRNPVMAACVAEQVDILEVSRRSWSSTRDTNGKFDTMM